MHEYRGDENGRPHSCEVAKIELLNDKAQNRQSTQMAANNGAESNNNSITTAKLLQNVEILQGTSRIYQILIIFFLYEVSKAFGAVEQGTAISINMADDVMRIPDVLSNGKRTPKMRGNTHLYEYTLKDADGTVFTVLTEIDSRREGSVDN